MKIMVVGGGGREHAIIKKLNENKSVTEIYALPATVVSPAMRSALTSVPRILTAL